MKEKTLLMAYIKSHIGQFAGLMIFIFVTNIVSLLLPLAIAQSFSQVFQFQSTRGKLLENFGFSWPTVFERGYLILLGLIAAHSMLDFWVKRKKGEVGESFLFWLRSKLFEHHLNMDLKHYEEKGSGRFLLRFSGDLSSIQQYLQKGILQFTGDVLLLGAGGVLIIILDWRVGLPVILFFGLFGWLIQTINRRIGSIEEQRRNQKSSLLAFLHLRLIHIISIKVLNRSRPELESFIRKADKVKTIGKSYYQWVALQEALIVGSVFLLIALAFFLIHFWENKGIPFVAENIFAIFLILLSWRGVMNRLLRIGLVWEKGSISFSKISKLLEKPLEPNGNLPDSILKNHPLIMENVGVQFGVSPLFSGLNLTLPAGRRMAVEVKPGCGKSVLLKLLAGLYRPTQGTIRFGSHEFSNLSPKSIRRNLSFLSEIFPLNGKSVLEAVSYSKRHYAKTTAIFKEWQQQFVALQSIDIDTPIGESGRLSSIQKLLLQWLRALAIEKPFLILEDPFNHLSEEEIALLWSKIPISQSVLLLLSDTKTIDLVSLGIQEIHSFSDLLE